MAPTSLVTSQRGGDQGAAAIEFAILLPILLLVIGGIVDFGRLLYTEIIVTNAAREGVRMAAMGFPSEAQTRVDAASPNLELTGTLATSPCGPSSGTFSEVRYTVTTVDEFEWLLLDAFMDLSAPQPASTASMRCGG